MALIWGGFFWFVGVGAGFGALVYSQFLREVAEELGEGWQGAAARAGWVVIGLWVSSMILVFAAGALIAGGL